MPVIALDNGTFLRPDKDGRFRYKVHQVLGSGGFGITYLAHDRDLDGAVVIKELAFEGACYRETTAIQIFALPGKEAIHNRLLEKFQDEARKLNRFRSPYIVRVTDVWLERGTAYYAMDFVESSRFLGDGKMPRPVPWPDAEQWALQLLEALEEVHSAGLVHGDIKPENVLLNEREQVVLIDFGTAREENEFKRTVTSAAYTPGYAPPELMLPTKTRPPGPWTDLYSWAMLVYGLVRPHYGPGGTPLDAMVRTGSLMQGGQPDPYNNAAADLLAAGLPPNWANLLGACLNLDADRRPRSVADVRSHLHSPSTSPLQASGPTVHDQQAMLAASADTQIPTDPGFRTGSNTTPSSGRNGLMIALAVFVFLLVAAGAVGLFFLISGMNKKANDDAGAEVATIDVGSRPAADAGSGTEATSDTSGTAPVPDVAVVDTSAGADTALAAAADTGSEQAKAYGASCEAGDDCASAVCSRGVCVAEGFAHIPGGTFTMGSPASEPGRDRDEAAHPVTISAFSLMETEVTQGQWEAVMGTTPSRFRSCGDNCPVERVSWFDAVAYLNALSRSNGLQECYVMSGCRGRAGGGCRSTRADECVGDYRCRSVSFVGTRCTGYRLPTEAEWEYAARAGTQSARYCGDDSCIPSIAWHEQNADGSSHPIGTKAPNAWGLNDMFGNVWEWTWDWYSPYATAPSTDPTGPREGEYRSRRGASWQDASTRIRAAYRNGTDPTDRRSFIGFRAARSLPPR